MSEQTFLVPANSKKQGLIFGFFRPIDLIIFCIGVALTLILLFILSVDTILNVIIIMLPICIAGMLVFPIPNYQNVLCFLGEMFKFYTGRRRYVWRGWCYKYEQRDE